MKLYFTMVGSRETPTIIMNYMSKLSRSLCDQGMVLRSGGASGSDEASEALLNDSHEREIFIPWKGFNGSKSQLYTQLPEAEVIASQIHPAWNRLTDGAKKLHSRNCHQVLGKDLQTPSSFTICWTENGEKKGGTRTAIVLSEQHNIPVFNMGLYSDIETIKEKFKKFIKELS